jgi:hypothetical protein
MAFSLVLTAPDVWAQGVLDRLLGDNPSGTISPADLVAAGVWVLDSRQGLANFPEAQMRAAPHVLVVLSANTQAPSFVLRLETPAECVAAARSLTSVHGGRLAYCHPLS